MPNETPNQTSQTPNQTDALWGLLHAEWFKLVRRPLAWILLGILLLLLLLRFALIFAVVGLHDGTFLEGTRIEVLREAQVEEFRRELRFPGIFGGVLGHINSIGGIFAVILAAGSLGSEYSWGTLRLQLARQPDRRRYLLAKVVMLLLVLVVGMLVMLLVGVVLALGAGQMLGNPGSLSLWDVVLLPVGLLRALYVILPYVLLTLAVCVIGRSVFAGVAGGLVFIAFDVGAGSFALLANLGNPLITFLVNLPLQQNINTLVLLNSSSYGLDPSAFAGLNPELLPSPLQATIMIGLYSALFAGYAYYSLTRRDIGGAS